MAEENKILFEAIVDTGNSQKTVGELRNEFKGLGDEAKAATLTWTQFLKEKMGPYMQQFGSHGDAIREIAKEWKVYKETGVNAMGNVNTGLRTSNTSFNSLLTQIRGLEGELHGLTAGTEKYNAKLREVAELKTKFSQLRQEINALNPEAKLRVFQNLTNTISTGFTGAISLMASFGVQGEGLQQVLLRIQAVMMFTQAIQSMGELVKVWRIFNLVIAANPIMMAVAALGALATILFVTGEKTEDATSVQRKYNDELERTKNLQQEINAIVTKELADREKAADRLIQIAKAEGKSTDDLEEQKLKSRINYLRSYYQTLDDEDAEKKKYYDLFLQAQFDYETMVTVHNAETKTKEREDQIKKDEEDVKLYEKELEEKKKKQEDEEKDRIDKMNALEDEIEAYNKLQLDLQKEIDGEKEKLRQEDAKNWVAANRARMKAEELALQETEKKEIDAANKKLARQKMLAQNLVTISGSLAGSLRNLNEALSKDAQKKAQHDKEIAIFESGVASAQAIAGAVKAVWTKDPDPTGVSQAIAIAAAIVAITATIKAAKKSMSADAPPLDGGGGGDTGGGDGAYYKSLNTANIPLQEAGTMGAQPLLGTTTGTGTQISEEGMFQGFQGQGQALQVYVLESDIKNVAQKVSVIEQKATF